MGRPRTRPDDPSTQAHRAYALDRYYQIKNGTWEDRPKAAEQMKLPLRFTSPNEKAQKRDRRRDIMEMLADYKLAKQCADCDRHFDRPWHLDFDHLPGAEKSFNLSKAGGRSLEAIMAEVDKCEVVCALCHRDRTYLRRGGVRHG